MGCPSALCCSIWKGIFIHHKDHDGHVMATCLVLCLRSPPPQFFSPKETSRVCLDCSFPRLKTSHRSHFTNHTASMAGGKDCFLWSKCYKQDTYVIFLLSHLRLSNKHPFISKYFREHFIRTKSFSHSMIGKIRKFTWINIESNLKTLNFTQCL